MFKKDKEPEIVMTPEQKIIATTKAIQDLKHKKRPVRWVEKGNIKYSHRNERINNQIDDAIKVETKKLELAEKEFDNPQLAPQKIVYDKSRRTTLNITTGDIGSNNKNGMNDNSILSGKTTGKTKKKPATHNEIDKKTKAKLILFTIVVILVAAGLMALIFHVHNCLNSGNDNSSSTYSVQII